MPITEKEHEEINDNFHPWDINDVLNNASRELWDKLHDLYEKTKDHLDPESSPFEGKQTNDALIDILEMAEEIQTEVDDQIEKLESITTVLSMLINAIPDSVYDEDV